MSGEQRCGHDLIAHEEARFDTADPNATEWWHYTKRTKTRSESMRCALPPAALGAVPEQEETPDGD